MGGQNSGRPPKPAAIRALHGSRTRPNHQEEPTIPAEPAPSSALVVPPPPRDLIRAEQAYWREFAPLLAGAKVLTPADVETLADYCRACQAVVERGRRLRKAYRPPMVTLETGKRRRGDIDESLVRMLDSQLRGWIERKTKLAEQLGLTAISRTRVAWSGHHQGPSSKPAGPLKPQSTLSKLQEQAASLRRPVGVAK